LENEASGLTWGDRVTVSATIVAIAATHTIEDGSAGAGLSLSSETMGAFAESDAVIEQLNTPLKRLNDVRQHWGSGRTFRNAYRRRRCIVPVDLFFEWSNGSCKVPNARLGKHAPQPAV
jgi:putative SOS response-associated peptidase YedK